MKDAEQIANRLLELQSFLHNLLAIKRLIYLPSSVDGGRQETDTEHSFHLAVVGWYLARLLGGLDENKVIKYALSHDMVEIYAGDSMAIGRSATEQREKQQKEKHAVEKIRQEWPDFPELMESFEAYESQADKEAVFVKALDKLLPEILQILSEGETWKRYDMQKSEVYTNRDEKMKNSKEITAIWAELKKIIDEHPEWFNPGKAD